MAVRGLLVPAALALIHEQEEKQAEEDRHQTVTKVAISARYGLGTARQCEVGTGKDFPHTELNSTTGFSLEEIAR